MPFILRPQIQIRGAEHPNEASLRLGRQLANRHLERPHGRYLLRHKPTHDTRTLSGDEGFGSLDGDTLEIALTALDSLNASGKMIDIISHVEALKERIPAQIRVKKAGVSGTRGWWCSPSL